MLFIGGFGCTSDSTGAQLVIGNGFHSCLKNFFLLTLLIMPYLGKNALSVMYFVLENAV